MSFIEDELLWCPDNDGRLVDLASCLDGNNGQNNTGQNNQGTINTQMIGNNNNNNNNHNGMLNAQSAATALAAAALEHLQQNGMLSSNSGNQQQQNQHLQNNNDTNNNNISSSSSSGNGSCNSSSSSGGGGGVVSNVCDLANLDSLEGEPEEILRHLAENPFEIEYFFSDMPGVEVKEEILTDMVGYDDSTAFITSSFTPSSPGPAMNCGGGGGGVSTTTGPGCSGGQNQGRYSISANSLLAEKLMANSNNNNNNNSGTEDVEELIAMQQRPAGKPPDPTKGEYGRS